MSQLVHPAYLHELKEVDGSGSISSEDAAPQKRVLARKAVDWELVRQYLRPRCLPFVSGLSVSLAAVFVLGLMQGPDGAAGSTNSSLEAVSPTAMERMERMEREMELMKKIVSGLVDSVQTLSKEGAIKDADTLVEGPFPIPVEVTSPKAALRKEADRSATVVADVAKGTVLLAHASAGGWLKVSTPKGETAWVSKGLVAEKKTWR
jgi:hypothetical protein